MNQVKDIYISSLYGGVDELHAIKALVVAEDEEHCETIQEIFTTPNRFMELAALSINTCPANFYINEDSISIDLSVKLKSQDGDVDANQSSKLHEVNYTVFNLLKTLSYYKPKIVIKATEVTELTRIANKDTDQDDSYDTNREDLDIVREQTSYFTAVEKSMEKLSIARESGNRGEDNISEKVYYGNLNDAIADEKSSRVYIPYKIGEETGYLLFFSMQDGVVKFEDLEFQLSSKLFQELLQMKNVRPSLFRDLELVVSQLDPETFAAVTVSEKTTIQDIEMIYDHTSDQCVRFKLNLNDFEQRVYVEVITENIIPLLSRDISELKYLTTRMEAIRTALYVYGRLYESRVSADLFLDAKIPISNLFEPDVYLATLTTIDRQHYSLEQLNGMSDASLQELIRIHDTNRVHAINGYYSKLFDTLIIKFYNKLVDNRLTAEDVLAEYESVKSKAFRYLIDIYRYRYILSAMHFQPKVFIRPLLEGTLRISTGGTHV